MTAAIAPTPYASYSYLGHGLDAWRAAGNAKLAGQRMQVMRMTAYYNGEFPLTFIPGSNRDVFRRLLREAPTNWGELVVNAVAERLQVIGFSFGDQSTDDAAWLLWQDNQMDADAELAQTDSLVGGLSPVGVWPDESRASGVRIDIEHASQVTLFYRPGTRRDPIAAFKSFGADTMRDNMYDPILSNLRTDVLITPDRVQTWIGDESYAEVNEVGLVPYVEVIPIPQTIGFPRSELHSVRTIQNRIHTTIYNRMVATDFGAFRQITASGVKLTKDASGVYQAPFNVGADRLLTSENPDARFGAIPESSMSGYLNAVQDDVTHLAAITQTPPHYLLGRVVNASGDALKAAEAGLVSKVRRRAAHIGEGWEQVMRLALAYVGDVGTTDVQAEVIWRDFETRSEGELVDALFKMARLAVPRNVLWRRWGLSPQETADWPEGDKPIEFENPNQLKSAPVESAAGVVQAPGGIYA